MEKIKLSLNTIYSFEINNISFGNLNNEALNKLFLDGRIFGRMIEPLISEIFDDFQCSVGGNSKWDLIRKNSSKKQEIKTFTKNGCDISPSDQKGKGRTHNESEFRKRAADMELYFIVDNRTFPKIQLIAFSSAEILSFPYKKVCKIPETIFEEYPRIELGKI